VLARRSPGTTLEQVRAELGVLASVLAAGRPRPDSQQRFVAFPADAVRILPEIDDRLRTASGVVLGVSALVLLIACTNVANLLLARAVARRREIATRRALGAGTAAVVRLHLAEGLVLAFLGGALALGLARVSNAALAAVRLPLPVDLALGLAVDGRVVLFTLALAMAAVLAFAMAPAAAAAQGDVATMLREGGGSAGGARQRRVGAGLVAAQVALCLVLLVDTGLAVRSLLSAHEVDPGFEPEGVVAATFATSLRGERRDELLRGLTAQARGLPGVEAAGLAGHLPLTIEITFDRVAPAETAAALEEWPQVDSALVGPGYFETLRIPVLRGRPVTDRDGPSAPLAAVVNETLAARLWPGTDPIGRTLRVAGEEARYAVVGVVGDGKYRTLGEAPRPFLYRAIGQAHDGGADTGEITTGTQTLVVRAPGSAAATQVELRRLLRRLDPRVALTRLGPLEDALGVALFLPRVAAVLFAVLGLLGLALAALGVYGLMAYTASRRTREIGIRLAVGATPGRVTGLLVRQGLGSAVFGLTLGLAAARATSPALGAVLYGVEPGDPLTFGAVTAFLALVAWAASYVPARRAAALDLPRALREE
jgi:predicted permease